MEEKEKNIDDILKDTSSNFTVFITGLAMQALVFLGDIPNPLNNKKEPSLTNAKYMIDTLGMLREKTKQNISADEEKVFDALLYELRMKYLELTKKEKKE